MNICHELVWLKNNFNIKIFSRNKTRLCIHALESPILISFNCRGIKAMLHCNGAGNFACTFMLKWIWGSEHKEETVYCNSDWPRTYYYTYPRQKGDARKIVGQEYTRRCYARYAGYERAQTCSWAIVTKGQHYHLNRLNIELLINPENKQPLYYKWILLWYVIVIVA